MLLEPNTYYETRDNKLAYCAAVCTENPFDFDGLGGGYEAIVYLQGVSQPHNYCRDGSFWVRHNGKQVEDGRDLMRVTHRRPGVEAA